MYVLSLPVNLSDAVFQLRLLPSRLCSKIKETKHVLQTFRYPENQNTTIHTALPAASSLQSRIQQTQYKLRQHNVSVLQHADSPSTRFLQCQLELNWVKETDTALLFLVGFVYPITIDPAYLVGAFPFLDWPL